MVPESMRKLVLLPESTAICVACQPANGPKAVEVNEEPSAMLKIGETA